MADEKKPIRVVLGFHAGGSLPLRLAPDKLDELRRMLNASATGFKEIEADDGMVLVNLEQVIYLRIESDDHRVGF